MAVICFDLNSSEKMAITQMTKSKFKIGYVFWFLLMTILTSALATILFKVIQRIEINGLWTTTWIGILLILIIIVAIIVLKDFKLIYIDNEKRKIKWFSILFPFGNSINLTEYIGTIKSYEHGSQGSYQTAYLVDKNRMTEFKINGLFYKNFDELFEAVNLKEIKMYEMSFVKYMKLLFIGKIRV